MTRLRPVAYRWDVHDALGDTVIATAPVVTEDSIRLDEGELQANAEANLRRLDPPVPADRWRRLVALYATFEPYLRAGAASTEAAFAAMRPADAKHYEAVYASLQPGDLELLGSPSPPMLFKPNLC